MIATASLPKPAKQSYLLLGLLGIFLAFIVTKEVVLPPVVLILGTLAIGVALFVVGISRPHVIIYVLVAYLPFSKVLAGDFGGLAMAFNFTNLLMGFVIISWIMGKFSTDEPAWISTPLNFPLYLFMAVGCLAVFRGTYYDASSFMPILIEFKRWMTPIFIYFLVLNTVKERETVKNVAVTLMVVTTLVGLMAIYDYIELGEVGDLERARVGGISDHSNSLAAFFSYYMFLPLGFFFSSMQRANSWLLLLPFLIQFRGIMVTFSRGGYIACAAGLLAITFFKRNKFHFIMLLFLAWLAFLNPILLPAGIRYRMSQTFEKQVSYHETADELEESLESSAQTRVEIWKGALKMIKDYPLFGIGYGLFYQRIQYYWRQARPIDAHNTYLIIAAEMGVPALVIFLWIIALVMKNTFDLYRTTKNSFAHSLALGFLGGLFGLLVSNMFGSRLDSQEISSYFWILAALVMRFKIIDRKESQTQRSVPGHYFKTHNQKLDACWVGGKA